MRTASRLPNEHLAAIEIHREEQPLRSIAKNDCRNLRFISARKIHQCHDASVGIIRAGDLPALTTLGKR